MNGGPTLRSLSFTAAALLLPLFALALVLAGWQQSRLTQRVVAQQLDHASATLRLIEAQQRDTLQTRAELVAGNRAFVSYVAQALESSALPGMGADVASLGDILVERREQFALDMLGLLGLDGRVIAATDASLLRRRELAREPAIAAAIDTLQASGGLLHDDGRALLLAVEPLLLGGSVQGFLIAGRRLDDGFAGRLAASTGGDAVVLLAEAGRVELLASSSIGPRLRDDPAQLAALGAATTQPLAGDAPPLRLQVDGVERRARLLAPFGERAQSLHIALFTPAADTLPSLLLSPLLLLMAAVSLVTLFVVRALWRGLLQPLQLLPELLDATAGGDRHRVMPPGGAALPRHIAAAFNRLVVALRDPAPLTDDRARRSAAEPMESNR